VVKYCFLILAILIAAGATQPSTPSTAPNTPATASQPVWELQAPYAEVAKVYDEVFETLSGNYYSQAPDVDKKHTARMRAFIAKQHPRAQFVQEIIQPDGIMFERALKDGEYRASATFKRILDNAVSRARSKVNFVIRRDMYIYTAKYVDKDRVRTELLQMAATDDEVRFANSVSDQATPEEVAKRSPDYKPVKGDRIYNFRTASETWTNLMGRAGYLVVRDGKIAQVIITSLN
jgi:hypothetical protein